MILAGNAQKMNDEQLMIKYQDGDHQAFEVLYLRHESKVYAYLRKRLPDQDQVEEVFQNTFLKVHKSRHHFNPKFLFIQWLYTVARSELLDFCKKKKVVHIEYIDQGEAKEEIDSDLDLDNYKNLSDKEKELLSLKFISDNDYEEISNALNISQSNARKIFSRAIKKIKGTLSGEGND
ncbi:RNA polymerase sigma factor [Halobacteriovorax sp.]|uniref:RNA polymerase sigma factor n=1 Tax=Halobacteriovorax sp. TaxID=2020862 RepID=UPI0035660796